jgi:phosphatidylglycerophosphate synthase
MTIQNSDSGQPSQQIPADSLNAGKKRPTLDNIRACQPEPMSEGIMGLVERKGSLYITWLMVQTPITPNQITSLWIVVGIGGACLLATGQYLLSLIGALLYLLVLVLDDVDGEVARYKNTKSLLGIYLDLIGHNIVKALLFTGMSLGVYWKHPELWVVLLGILASLSLTVADNLRFYHLYLLNLNHLQSPKHALRSRFYRLAAKLENLWRSQGLYLMTLIAAITGTLTWLLIFYSIMNPVWMFIVLIRKSRELITLSAAGCSGVTVNDEM